MNGLAKLAGMLLLASTVAPLARAQQSQVIYDYCTPGPYIVFFEPGSP